MRLAHTLSGDWEWSARVLSALAGLATGFLTYDLARRALGPPAAGLAVLLLAANPHFVGLSRMGRTDVPLTALLTLSIYAYWRALLDPRWWLVCGTGIGLAFMTKGFAAGVAPIAIGLHIIASRSWQLLASPWPWAAA
jgi:4-amino-4-deoxy-L-arabinose transferase-like glycosyltransferase